MSKQNLKINYLGFLGFLGFLGLNDPWYFLFFLFFLFFVSAPKPRRGEGGLTSRLKVEAESFSGGLEEYNKKTQEKKEQAKQKILEFFKNKNKISNKDVVSLLNISTATAVRYLDELEKEGKVKQVGETGKYVFYSIV
jgi:predicted HTH transcriptional regulator